MTLEWSESEGEGEGGEVEKGGRGGLTESKEDDVKGFKGGTDDTSCSVLSHGRPMR